MNLTISLDEVLATQLRREASAKQLSPSRPPATFSARPWHESAARTASGAVGRGFTRPLRRKTMPKAIPFPSFEGQGNSERRPSKQIINVTCLHAVS